MATPETTTTSTGDSSPPPPPPHYTATLDPATNKYFFTTPDPKQARSSGWKYPGPCQRLADQVRNAAEAADS